MKIGKPYQVMGKWYVPKDDRHYKEVGIASWYGPGFHGKATANGEPYDMDALTAAHKTLPLPSFVEVTNLENGRSVMVRVNDRGPFVEGRIIDLSRRSAQLLGVEGAGTARVRVKRVYPSARDIARLDVARPALPAIKVAAQPRLAAEGNGAGAKAIYVQVAAVSDALRAHGLADALRAIGPGVVERSAAGLYRVRLGPFADAAAAATALAQVQAAGYQEARVVGAAPFS